MELIIIRMKIDRLHTNYFVFTWIYRKAATNFSREPENGVQKVLYGASLAGSLILLAGTENSANGIRWLILVIGSKRKMRRSSFPWEKWPSHFLKGIPQTGFEPAVSSLGGRRFIQLSYWGILCIIVDFFEIQRAWKQMCGMLFTTKWPTALQPKRC